MQLSNLISTNIKLQPDLAQIAKFNDCQYFRIYGTQVNNMTMHIFVPGLIESGLSPAIFLVSDTIGAHIGSVVCSQFGISPL